MLKADEVNFIRRLYGARDDSNDSNAGDSRQIPIQDVIRTSEVKLVEQVAAQALSNRKYRFVQVNRNEFIVNVI